MYPCASRAQYSIAHMFMLSCVSQVTIYPRSRGRGLQLAGTEGGAEVSALCPDGSVAC